MANVAWKSYPAVPIWLEEDIWGHRLYDESTPEFTTLEMLNVLNALGRNETASQTNGPQEISHRHSLVLRTILFNNPNLREPLLRYLDDSDRWEEQYRSLYAAWAQYGGASVPKTVQRYNISGPEDFRYLRKRFPDYETYVRLVEILRQTSTGFESKKRWTSKFLFPYCELALFEDINDRTLSTDRRFFARSGELTYLMLSRSGHGPEIAEALRDVFDEAPHAKRWERVVKPLMHDHDKGSLAERVPIGYLPEHKHALPLFERFGEDVVQLLRSQLPEYDVLPYLSRVIGFHLLNYVLATAAYGLYGEEDRVHYVLEIRGERPDVVRRLARRQYQLNGELSMMRINAELERLRAREEVDSAVRSDDRETLRWWLKNNHWKRADKDKGAVAAKNAEALWAAFEDAVRRKHSQHLANVHHEYARACGFSSRVGTRAYRYCPTDAFLRTMVFANVERNMEYESFLDRLFWRYGFVVAKRHATAVETQQDLGDFDANDRRLRDRLSALGLLQVMSDDLAFVVNRYRGGESAA